MRTLLAIAMCLSAAVAEVRADRRDWTGSAACGQCHPAELAAWLATPHARTRDRLGAGSARDGRCLGCHATGEAPAGPVVAVEVGCEACHGAGAAYAAPDLMRNPIAARALGLVDLSTPAARAAVCAGCHVRPTRGTPFDPAAPVHPSRVPPAALTRPPSRAHPTLTSP